MAGRIDRDDDAPRSTTATETSTPITGSVFPAAYTSSPIFQDDWFTHLPSNDHVRFFISTNWAASPLGPLPAWDVALRIQVFAVMSDSFPGCLYWGDRRIAIYNAAFAPLAGKAHPTLMGSAFEEAFPEITPQINVVFDMAKESGVAGDVNEAELFVERNGLPEETYFTGNFNPIRGLSGKIEGFHNTTREVTKQKLAARRTAMLNSMEVSTGVQDESLASRVIPFLEANERDITMALLYEVDEETTPGARLLILRGQIGVPADHPIAVQRTDLSGSEGLVPLFRKARSGIVDIPVDDRFKGVEWRGFSEGSKNVSILQLSASGKVLGFLVVGANARRPIDEEHRQFMKSLAARVSSIAGSVIMSEEAKIRHDRLEKELADTEKQIRYMAVKASVGMLHSSIDGKRLWANEQYYRLTGQSSDDDACGHLSFLDAYIEEDRQKALNAWNTLLGGSSDVTVELHLKKMFTPPVGDPEPACISSGSFPYFEDGKVQSVMTCISDISALKWAEQAEARKALDAYEAKKQQEEFIDIVSHEMRNPLAAILMSADMITKSLTQVKSQGATEARIYDALESNVDAAKTIVMCANHQKRIVDDVLTLSKLEYMMLSISPVAVQFQDLVDSTLKMFESDVFTHRILATASADLSIKQNDAAWVSCDPSRLTQILVNFLTNAIKFTKGERTREISIHYGAVKSNPRAAFPKSVNWAQVDEKTSAPTSPSEPVTGQPLYLIFKVIDTGVGMTSEEMHKLFSRFEQANTKTSIKYGGSGLGLFICKKLTEKMGGEIGVSSVAGEGSIFAFYIQAHRASPEVAEPIIQPPLPIRSLTSPNKSAFSSEVHVDSMHVLLVEDNVVNQKILTKQLRQAGCFVTVANHGLEALEKIRQSALWRGDSEGKHIDIILMDWEMPVMDGLTCSREIRKFEKSGDIVRHIEIMATTANARDEQLQMALDSGIDSVISKPFIVGDLLKQMRERLELSERRLPVARTFSSP